MLSPVQVFTPLHGDFTCGNSLTDDLRQHTSPHTSLAQDIANQQLLWRLMWESLLTYEMLLLQHRLLRSCRALEV